MEYTMSDTVRTLFKSGTIVTMDAEVPNLVTGDVLVEGDRIVAVEANIRADGAEVIDAAGKIALPGLIDAHHHAWLGVMRRLMPDVDDLFAYIDVVAEKLGAHCRPIDMYLSTKLTAVASLDAGITTIIDACHNSRLMLQGIGPIRTHRVCLAVFRRTRLDACRLGHDRVRCRIHLRTGRIGTFTRSDRWLSCGLVVASHRGHRPGNGVARTT
jgi:cytosine/adenosine deaminase-related metal-dependent hydrolase